MIVEEDFTLISKKNGISLFQIQTNNPNELSLVVQISDQSKGTCRKYYKTIRQIEGLGKIKQFCSSLPILLQYLKKPQNFQLDIQNKVLYILCKNMMNSEETLRIGEIHLNDNSEWDIEQFKDKLQYIQKSANQDTRELNVKNLFGSIAYCLEYLVYRRQSDGNIKRQVLECKQQVQQKSKKTNQNIQHIKKQFENLSTNVYQFFLKQHGQLIQLIQSQTRHTNQKLKKIHQNKESLRMDIQKLKLFIESQISEHKNQIIQSNKQYILKEQFYHEQKKVQNVKKQFQQIQNRFNKKIKQLSLLSMQTSRRISIIQQDLYKLKIQNKGISSQKGSSNKIPSQESKDYHINHPIQQGHVEPVTALVWTNNNSQYYDKIQFAKNMIKNTRDGSITVFGKKINRSSYVYVVKIDKLKKSIALGFIDVQYIKGQFVGPNLIYIGKKGKCYISGKEENSQIIFNEGDTIQISASFTKGTVSWKKNKQKKYQINCQLLKQSNQNKIAWVPYILMSSQNDTVYVFD